MLDVRRYESNNLCSCLNNSNKPTNHVLFCETVVARQRSVLGPKRLIYFFMNNIFNLKGNCVLRTLKNSFAIF